MLRGLNDEEILLGILSKQNQEMTLEQVLQFVEAKEAAKRSATQLTFQPGTQIIHTDAATSSYKREKRDNIKFSNQKPCCYCRRKGRSFSGPSHVRQKQCPAFNLIVINLITWSLYVGAKRNRLTVKLSSTVTLHSTPFAH